MLFCPVGNWGFRIIKMCLTSLHFGQLMFNSVFIVVMTVILGLTDQQSDRLCAGPAAVQRASLAAGHYHRLIIIPFEAVAIPLLLLVNKLPWFGGLPPGWIPTMCKSSPLSPMPFPSFCSTNSSSIFPRIWKKRRWWMAPVFFAFSGTSSAAFQTDFCHRRHSSGS